MTQLQKLLTLQRAVLERIEELREISQSTWGVSPEMNILYDLTSVNTLGSANYFMKRMRLNKYLLLEFGEVYIDEVVVHEYAHFVVSALSAESYWGHRRVQAHGREFKNICSCFGIIGKSTTDKFSNSVYLKTKQAKINANKKVFYYSCDCGIPKELSSIRHNKIQRGQASYNCGRCKSELSFIKQKSALVG